MAAKGQHSTAGPEWAEVQAPGSWHSLSTKKRPPRGWGWRAAAGLELWRESRPHPGSHLLALSSAEPQGGEHTRWGAVSEVEGKGEAKRGGQGRSHGPTVADTEVPSQALPAVAMVTPLNLFQPPQRQAQGDLRTPTHRPTTGNSMFPHQRDKVHGRNLRQPLATREVRGSEEQRSLPALSHEGLGLVRRW